MQGYQSWVEFFHEIVYKAELRQSFSTCVNACLKRSSQRSLRSFNFSGLEEMPMLNVVTTKVAAATQVP